MLSWDRFCLRFESFAGHWNSWLEGLLESERNRIARLWIAVSGRQAVARAVGKNQVNR